MFPSNSNGNNDPIAYSDHSSSTIFQRHNFFLNDIITTPLFSSKQELDFPLSSFHHFPLSPYHINHCDQLELELEEAYDVFLHGQGQGQQHHDLLLQQTLTTTTADNNSVSETVINMPDSSKNEESTVNCTKKSSSHSNNDNNNNNAASCTDQQQITRKRSSKRDRHSKIYTAKGPRDRRMRLSLEVAREFFGLQDMLGYDKASKTVEWLLKQAKPEIKKLVRSLQMNHNHNLPKSPSSTSEGEVVSAIDDKAAAAAAAAAAEEGEGKKKVRQPRKPTFRPLARDLREKARARAKARTKAKSLNSNNDLINITPCPWTSFETGHESGTHQDHNNNNSLQQPVVAAEVIKGLTSSHASDHMSDDSLAIMNKWSPNSIFNCLQSTGGINQEHQQLPSFLSFGKPWEG